MPLFVQNGAIPDPVGGVISSDTNAVARDLANIAKGDLGLGHDDGAVLGDVLIKVTYNPTVTGAGPTLIKELVGVPQQIQIVGADRATVKSTGGITGLGDTSQQPNGVIRIIYDTTGCDGQGTHVFGPNNKKIANPPFVILFHELVHAKHIARGTLAANPERQARDEENRCRAENQLELRDIENDGGGCGGVTPSQGGSQGLGKFCLIATAAFGSPQATQVQALRHFRDVHLRRTAFGEAFFNLFYSDYYLYSPQVVQLMDSSYQLSNLVRTILVEPLLDFLGLLDRALQADLCCNAFQHHFSSTFRHRLQTLANYGYVNQAERIHATLSQLCQMRASGKEVLGAKINYPSAIRVVPFIEYLGEVMQTGTTTQVYSTWALLEPLVITWSALANLAKPSADESVVTRMWAESIAVWLDRMPVPEILTTLTAAQLGDDLRDLGKHFFISSSVRKRFAERLLQDFRNQTSFDLEKLLKEAEYLP